MLFHIQTGVISCVIGGRFCLFGPRFVAEIQWQHQRHLWNRDPQLDCICYRWVNFPFTSPPKLHEDNFASDYVFSNFISIFPGVTVLIVMGAVMLIVVAFGDYGACNEKRCSLQVVRLFSSSHSHFLLNWGCSQVFVSCCVITIACPTQWRYCVYYWNPKLTKFFSIMHVLVDR